MAEQTKKEVIIDVRVQRDERIKEVLNQMGALTKEVVNVSETINQLHRIYKSGNVDMTTYSKALAQLTEKRKTAVKQLQSLSREEQNLVVANTAAKNSLNAMRAEINALKVQIADIDVDTPAFAEMAARIDTITQKVSKAEQSYGVFSRNVGNYASGFSEIGFQVQQLARELPTLSIGLPQFFLALSNNIPLFTDALVRARNEGKTTAQVLKDIGKSLVSWQTLLVVVISIITMFGKEIGEWIKSLGKADNGIKALRKSMSEMAGSVAAERAELAGLFNALSKAEEGTANYLAVRNVILDKYGDLLENEREEVRNLNDIATAYDTIAKKISAKAIMDGFSKQIEEQSKEYGEAYEKYYNKLLPDFTKKFGADGNAKLIEFLELLQDGSEESIAKAQRINNFFIDSGTTIGKFATQIPKMAKRFAELREPINATVQAMQELGEVYGFDTDTKKGGGSGNGNEEFQKAQRALELEQKLAEEKLKAERETAYNSEQIYNASEEAKFAFAQKWDEKEFEQEQKHQKQMLALQKQYGEITQEEYNTELEILAEQKKTFDAEQLTASVEFSEKAREQLLKDAEALRKEVFKYNEETEKQANKQKWEAFRQSVRDLASKGIISATESADLITASYASEKSDDNAISRKHAQARKREREGVLNDRLAEAWRDAQQRYEITKKFLEDELKLYEGNAAEQARIQKQIAENESRHRQEQLENFQTYTSEIGNLLESVSDLADSLYERELETEKANNEMLLADLEKRHKAGLISDKQYNKEKLRLDEDLAKKEALIARKQAIMERAMALFNIGVNTASAIMKIWAEVPKADFGVSTGILTALAAAAGAAQVAAVLAQPLPKARKGGRIQGATHEAGGVLIETERDERIIGANPSKAYPELLNLISYLGKRKMRLPDTGYATRRGQTISPEVLANEVGRQVAVAIDTNNQKQAEAIGRVVGQEVAEQMKNVKIYTAVTDVRKAERLHDRIVNSAKM